MGPLTLVRSKCGSTIKRARCCKFRLCKLMTRCVQLRLGFSWRLQRCANKMFGDCKKHRPCGGLVSFGTDVLSWIVHHVLETEVVSTENRILDRRGWLSSFSRRADPHRLPRSRIVPCARLPHGHGQGIFVSTPNARASCHLVALPPSSSLGVNLDETSISWERTQRLTWGKHASGAEGRGSSCGVRSDVTVSTWIENDEQRRRALVDREACMRCTCT